MRQCRKQFTNAISVFALALLAIGCSKDAPPADTDQAAALGEKSPGANRTGDGASPPALATHEQNLDGSRSAADKLPQIGSPDSAKPGEQDSPQYLEMGAAGAATSERSALAAADFAFDRLLATLVTAEGLVRYDALIDLTLRQQLQEVVDAYGRVELPDGTNDRLALWINAYNANVLLMAYRESRKSGFENVNGVPGFFDKTSITVAGEALTLDQLENERIRPMGDPRVHAALVRGAMGGPPLRNEPYAADQLDEQLDEQARRWVNDRTRNTAEGQTLRLSEVFKWRQEDFDRLPGGGIHSFLKRYARETSPVGRALDDDPQAEIQWLPYDWSLNAAPIDAPEPVK